METLVIGWALLGSFVGAFVIQKAALEGLCHILGRNAACARGAISATAPFRGS
jgi:hypothetical protein